MENGLYKFLDCSNFLKNNAKNIKYIYEKFIKFLLRVKLDKLTLKMVETFEEEEIDDKDSLNESDFYEED